MQRHAKRPTRLWLKPRDGRSRPFFPAGWRSSKFHLVRYFSLTSLSVFLGLTLCLSWLYDHHALELLKQSNEGKNVAAAQLIGNAIWDEFGSFLQDSAVLTPDDLRQSRKTRRLRLHVLNQIQGLPIKSVEIYGIQGRVVFATNGNRMGASELDHVEVADALSGSVSSVLVLGEKPTVGHVGNSDAPISRSANHLTSYVPLKTNLSNEIQGVIKVQTDVTPLVGQIRATKRTILLSSAGLLTLAYGVLFLLIQHANRLLQQQRQALSLAYEESKQKAADLSAALRQLQATQAQLIQTEKMSSLGHLVAGVAHEINNPVSFIHGNLKHITQYTHDLLAVVQLCQDEAVTPEIIQAFKEEIDFDFLVEDLAKLQSSMRLGTERIRDIVKSLKTFSRLDEAEMKAVDIHAGIDSTLVILNSQLKGNGQDAIRVVKRYANLPGIVCHASQINQVFMNILANAIDALRDHPPSERPDSPDNCPEIVITTARTSEAVTVSIGDNGPGIPASIRATIFDPFFTTKPVGKGTGLGLSISYGIVDGHGGTLTCQDGPNGGTEFIMTLPLTASPPASSRSGHPQAA